MITVSLETLKTGMLRATGRIDGRTVGGYFEGRDAFPIIAKALNAVASQHRYPNGTYDFTHIELNEAAKKALFHLWQLQQLQKEAVRP